MKHLIRSARDLGLVIRAVRTSKRVRQDDLAGTVKVSKQFTVDVERGKPTIQFDRAMLLMAELGITMSVEIDDQALEKLKLLLIKQHKKVPSGNVDGETEADA